MVTSLRSGSVLATATQLNNRVSLVLGEQLLVRQVDGKLAPLDVSWQRRFASDGAEFLCLMLVMTYPGGMSGPYPGLWAV